VKKQTNIQKRNDQAHRLRRFWEYKKSDLKVLDGIFWLLSGHSHLQSTKQTSLHLPSTSNGVFKVFDPRKTKAVSENHVLILLLQILGKPFSHKLINKDFNCKMTIDLLVSQQPQLATHVQSFFRVHVYKFYGCVHNTPWEYEGLILKTHLKSFPSTLHRRPENATITGDFGFVSLIVFEKLHTKTQNQRFQIRPFSWRISVKARPNGRNWNSFCAVCTGPLWLIDNCTEKIIGVDSYWIVVDTKIYM